MKTGLFGISLFFVLTVLIVPMIVYAPPPTSPAIGTPSIVPSLPTYKDKVTIIVSVNATRSSVQNVTVVYTTDQWKTINSTLTASYDSTTTLATAQIPALATGGSVTYYIVAFDTRGNRQVNNNSGNYYTYNVVAPPLTATTSNWIVYAVVAIVATVAAVASVKIMKNSSKPTPRRTN